MGRCICLFVLLLCFNTPCLNAQQPSGPPQSRDLGALAWEGLSRVRYERGKSRATISITRADYPEDSLRGIEAAAAHLWLTRLDPHEQTGIQLDGYGQLYVAAGQDEVARRQFDARLATPGLSADDRAYTLDLAVKVFADSRIPSRLPIAEQYLARLVALATPRTVLAARRFMAELTLIRAYSACDAYADVARHAQAAAAMLSDVPFKYRLPFFSSDAGHQDGVYHLVIDALKHLSDSQAHIEVLNATLERALTPPADSAAFDAGFAKTAQYLRNALDNSHKLQHLVGEPASPITANYWINTTDTTLHTLALNDGKVRLLEFGGWDCGPCVVMYHALARIQEAFHGQVEPILVTHTTGFWANRLIAAEQERPLQKAFFLDQHHVAYPIAIQLLPKTTTSAGDVVPDLSKDPNYQIYPVLDKPTTYLVDGHGIIRRVYLGYSHEIEAQIVREVQRLSRLSH